MLQSGYLISPSTIFLRNMTTTRFGRCWKKIFAKKSVQIKTFAIRHHVNLHPTLLVDLVKLGWKIKVWLVLWALEIFG
jgi:hypothetical protein